MRLVIALGSLVLQIAGLVLIVQVGLPLALVYVFSLTGFDLVSPRLGAESFVLLYLLWNHFFGNQALFIREALKFERKRNV